MQSMMKALGSGLKSGMWHATKHYFMYAFFGMFSFILMIYKDGFFLKIQQSS